MQTDATFVNWPHQMILNRDIRSREGPTSSVRASVLAGGLSLLALIIVQIVNSIVPFGIPPNIYLPIHILIEFGCVVVCFAVFVMGWYGYRQTDNRQDLFLGVAFLVVGSMDFVHTFSYNGMPDFLTANTDECATVYWLVARLIGAVALLMAAHISPNSRRRSLRPPELITLAFVLIAGIVTAITIFSNEITLALQQSTGALTSLKQQLGYGVIAIYIAAFWAVSKRFGRSVGPRIPLQVAIITAIAAEISLSMYTSPYDSSNMLAHVFKGISYYFVLQALFVSSLDRPYKELLLAREQVHESFVNVGQALGLGLRKDETLRKISKIARQMFQADMAAIGEIADDAMLEVNIFDGMAPDAFSVPIPESMVLEALETGEPMVVRSIVQHPRAQKNFVKVGLHSLVSAPIMYNGRAMGVVYVGTKQEGRYNDRDAEVLTAFADHAAIAIANAEYFEREHRIAEILQQVIFPPTTLEAGSFSIVGRYVPAWSEAEVGGDLYDYVDLGHGKVGIVIGDVSGKGLEAAVHTAIVKYSFQAYARDGYSPAEILTRVDEAFTLRPDMDDQPSTVFITVFCGILDTESGHLVYSNAGHEPPIKTTSAGDAVLLDSTSPILGAGFHKDYSENEIVIEPGDTLTLYTDGITESRVLGSLFGQEGLIEAVTETPEQSPEEIADHIFAKAREHASGLLRDDAALVVVKRARNIK